MCTICGDDAISSDVGEDKARNNSGRVMTRRTHLEVGLRVLHLRRSRGKEQTWCWSYVGMAEISCVRHAQKPATHQTATYHDTGYEAANAAEAVDAARGGHAGLGAHEGIGSTEGEGEDNSGELCIRVHKDFRSVVRLRTPISDTTTATFRPFKLLLRTMLGWSVPWRADQSIC